MKQTRPSLRAYAWRGCGLFTAAIWGLFHAATTFMFGIESWTVLVVTICIAGVCAAGMAALAPHLPTLQGSVRCVQSDHLVIPPGASDGRHRHPGIEEVYYVIGGDGEVKLNDETPPIHKGDAVPVVLNELHSFANNGTQDLEIMIIGIAAKKGVLETVEQ